MELATDGSVFCEMTGKHLLAMRRLLVWNFTRLSGSGRSCQGKHKDLPISGKETEVWRHSDRSRRPILPVRHGRYLVWFSLLTGANGNLEERMFPLHQSIAENMYTMKETQSARSQTFITLPIYNIDFTLLVDQVSQIWNIWPSYNVKN